MNQDRFLAACRCVLYERRESIPPSALLVEASANKCAESVVNPEAARVLIGTLGEKTLHAVLKHYLEPDVSKHEQKIGSYYADICGDFGIIEIQTRQFNKLRDKLEVFLREYPVTIVYPAVFQKRLIWIDEETGETTPPRRSPKRGNAYAIFPELYKIKSYLTHEGLSIRILLVDLDEYRRLNGWSADRKRGSWRSDRIPSGIQGDILLSCPGDYGQLIPAGLPPVFCSLDFSKEAKISRSAAQAALNVLFSLGAVRRVGKKGNTILYEQCYFSYCEQEE